MKKRLLAIAMCVGLAASMFAGCSSSEEAATSEAKSEASAASSAKSEAPAEEKADAPAKDASDIRICLLAKTVATDPWQRLLSGGQAAADDLGIELFKDGALDMDAHEEQLNMIENAISNGYDAIGFATDAEGAADLVTKAQNNGMYVAIMDTPIIGCDWQDCMIQFDTVEGGRQAAVAMIEGLDKAGKDYSGDDAMIIVQCPVSGVVTLDNRVEGFTEKMSELAPNIKVEVMYCGGDNAQALANAQDAWLTYGESIVGMYGLDDGVTSAIARCIEEGGLQGKFVTVGFDMTESTVGELENGNVYALIAQNLFEEGYLTVENLYKMVIGEEVEKDIMLSPTIVALENYKDEDIVKIWQ